VDEWILDVLIGDEGGTDVFPRMGGEGGIDVLSRAGGEGGIDVLPRMEGEGGIDVLSRMRSEGEIDVLSRMGGEGGTGKCGTRRRCGAGNESADCRNWKGLDVLSRLIYERLLDVLSEPVDRRRIGALPMMEEIGDGGRIGILLVEKVGDRW
jgi:hypothetical protein